MVPRNTSTFLSYQYELREVILVLMASIAKKGEETENEDHSLRVFYYSSCCTT